MATIRKRVLPSGGVRWQCDYRDGAGKRRARQFASKREADAFLVTARHQVANGVHTVDRASLTVDEAAALWLARAERDGLERSTLTDYRTWVRLHIRPFVGAEKLSRLTAPRIEAFADQLLTHATEPRSRSMVKRVVTALGAIVGEAHRLGLVAQNVARGIRLRVGSRHAKELAIPSQAEVRTLIAQAERHIRVFLLTGLFTGMRVSEIRGLTWDDVDFDARCVRVRQRADRYERIGPPKSKAGRREIPLPPALVTVLREWKLQSRPNKLGLVFCTRTGKPMSYANIRQRWFNHLQSRCGLTEERSGVARPKYGVHALRHWCISQWIAQGFTLKEVMTWAGHSSVQMTLGTYGHLISESNHDEGIAAIASRVLG